MDPNQNNGPDYANFFGGGSSGPSSYGTYNYGGSGANYGSTPYGGFSNPYAGSQFNTGANPFTASPNAAQSYLNTNAMAGFGAYTSQMPGGQANPYTRYLQNNYYPLYEQYQAYQMQNPYASFTDYLTANNQSLQQQYSNLSPIMRGESPQLAGKAQYVGF